MLLCGPNPCPVQLFIFFTIQQYGALHFALIMTIRQFLSIVLSCLVFSHNLSAPQWCVAGAGWLLSSFMRLQGDGGKPGGVSTGLQAATPGAGRSRQHVVCSDSVFTCCALAATCYAGWEQLW